MTTATRGKAALATLAEKVVTTYLQAVIAVLTVGSRIDTSAAQAAAIAAIPAALTVVANAASTAQIPQGLPFYVDLILRTARTYVVSFLGFAIAVPVFALDYSIAVAASAAALPAALAVLKAALASRIGALNSAALLPARLDLAAAA